jgi:hypothetical protein
MILRPEPRHIASFPVRISLAGRNGATMQISGRCTDFSASGMRVEVRDHLEVRSTVMVSSPDLGRLGHGVVRYCRREAMKYVVGLHFFVQIKLAGHARSRLLSDLRGATDPSR